jgi:hypothetical protein
MVVMMQMPSEKAPDPNSYIGSFYKLCWDTVKGDVIGAIQELFSLRANYWNLLNLKNLALITKKDGA